MPPHGSWKDHNVETLKGDPTSATGICVQPSRAQYNRWLDMFRKALGALLLLWIIPMALELEFVYGRYVPLVDIAGILVPDDADDPVFQFVVVSRAIRAGAQYSLPKPREPLENARHCEKNYRYIISSIASFSAQLSTRCRDAFPRLFIHYDMTEVPHPLAGLHEFASLHRIYAINNVVANSSTAWVEAFSALNATVKPDPQSIMEWLNKIEIKVQALNTAQVAGIAIDSALCGNVINRLANLEGGSTTTTRWLIRADALRTRNQTAPYIWSAMFDDLTKTLASDIRAAEEQKTNDTSSQKPRVQGAGTAFYTKEQMQRAFFLGQSAKTTQSPQPGGNRKEQGPHKNWRATCPVCKEEHPDGIESCPQWESKTKAIVEETSCRKGSKSARLSEEAPSRQRQNQACRSAPAEPTSVR